MVDSTSTAMEPSVTASFGLLAAPPRAGRRGDLRCGRPAGREIAVVSEQGRVRCAYAAVVVAAAAAALACGDVSFALYLVPFLLLVAPLVAGRYVGERALERLAARWHPRRRRARAVVVLRPRRVVLAARSRVLAAALGVRGPPAASLPA
jgi:hypothetical protein